MLIMVAMAQEKQPRRSFPGYSGAGPTEEQIADAITTAKAAISQANSDYAGYLKTANGYVSTTQGYSGDAAAACQSLR